MPFLYLAGEKPLSLFTLHSDPSSSSAPNSRSTPMDFSSTSMPCGTVVENCWPNASLECYQGVPWWTQCRALLRDCSNLVPPQSQVHQLEPVYNSSLRCGHTFRIKSASEHVTSSVATQEVADLSSPSFHANIHYWFLPSASLISVTDDDKHLYTAFPLK